MAAYQWWGQLEAEWIAFYTFPEVALGIEYPAEKSRHLKLWADLVQSCNWWWACEDFIVCSERPEHIAFDDQQRLHDEEGPAVKFRDGWGVHCLNGVRVPAEVVEAPGKLTVKQIQGEENLEVRRVMMERFGHDRYLRESKAKLVHQDEWGKLWWCEVPDDVPLVMVEVVNSSPEPDGTYKDYFLRVDEQCRPMYRDDDGQIKYGPPQKLTALNAVASTYGLTGEEYAGKLVVRT